MNYEKSPSRRVELPASPGLLSDFDDVPYGEDYDPGLPSQMSVEDYQRLSDARKAVDQAYEQ